MGQDQDNPAVTVIIPVYRDREVTRRCLDSLAASTLPATSCVLVIDDHSPEAAVSELCRELCSNQGFELLVNEQNRGFVGTANRGISHAVDTDVILLNSDTEVSGDWVQRLQAHAYAHEKTATVTPFSNNGTICSYPVIQDSNPLPADWDTPALDSLFAQANAGLNHPIPTAVGFCMYIKRTTLSEIGLLDEDNFGHGYGEENDFSLRASSRGWKHLVAADVFVYHAGSVSFAGEAPERKRSADQTMLLLHPEYNHLVTAFLQSDPLHIFRQRVDQQRLAQRPEDQQHILEEHQRYCRSILDRFEEFQQERGQLQALLTDCREQFAARDTAVETERVQLEALLTDCREQFASTDTALTHADDVVARQERELKDLDNYAKTLVQHIETMEKSRSWRYTTWLRRKE
jgi:GT2 family glycosyltransferase